MKTIDDKIIELRGILFQFEKDDKSALPQELRDLRSLVFYTHNFITTHLQDSYLKQVCNLKNDSLKDLPTLVTAFFQFQPLFDSVGFRELVKICKEKNVINDEKKIKLFEKINTHRNHFGHPTHDNIKYYKNKNHQLQTLKELVVGMGVASQILTRSPSRQETVKVLNGKLEELLKS